MAEEKGTNKAAAKETKAEKPKRVNFEGEVNGVYSNVSVNLIVGAEQIPALNSYLQSLPAGWEVVVCLNKPSGSHEESERIGKVETLDNGTVLKLVEYEYAGSSPLEFHFANARNVALKHSTRKWIFWLDIDDRLNPSDFPAFNDLKGLAAGIGGVECGTYGFSMPFNEDEKGEYYNSPHVRIFRRDSGALWQYGIHEQIGAAITRQGYKIVQMPIGIEHLGYQCSKAEYVKKLERNVSLLLRELQGRVTDPEYNVHLRYLAGNTKQLLDLKQES